MMCNIKFDHDINLPEDDSDEDSDTSLSESMSSSGDDEGSAADENSVVEDADPNSDEEEGDENGDDRVLEDVIYETIRRIREAERTHPPRIDCEDLMVDISFHPQSNMLAAAGISGDVTIYKYDLDSVSVAHTLELHTKACRAVEYSEDGLLLYSASKDRSVMISDSETCKLTAFYDKAHDNALYCLTVISEHLFATGDEEGVVKLWDRRHREPVFSIYKIKDYITSMVTSESKRYLACTTGENTLATINIPARKFHVESEQFEVEMTCAGLFKDEAKLVCGAANGKMVTYNWGDFGLHVDEFPGPCKKAINCQIALNDNIIVSGWEDGVIRATHLYPNKHLGVVGQHKLSIESLDISHDGEFVVSCSLDQKINFWPVSFFNEMDLNIGVDSETNLPSSQFTDRKDFFAGLDE